MRKFTLSLLALIFSFLLIIALPKETDAQSCLASCSYTGTSNCGAIGRLDCGIISVDPSYCDRNLGGVGHLCCQTQCPSFQFCAVELQQCDPAGSFPCCNQNIYSCLPGSGGSYCRQNLPTLTPSPVPATYDCFNGSCVIGTTYSTLSACQSACSSSSPTNTPGANVPNRPALSPRCGTTSINTAIGCIPVGDSNAFVGFIIKWAIGISGGVALILIVASGFQIITSTGNPQKVQAGKELLTAALTGLMLIIFSVFILDLIGVRILQIPGL